ncbi:hypothetical protein PRK78_000969 [Emydomyces testavorans]|uniref:Major facilitator superfamily (MFS) profile domain-containing protein n=1 Tax=Emydomyces testavorans TaxID=2070801 RepID=A0AAF0DC29_9EURO|nr:hypothetical protein PRK78_000969 [Emydomyces testavorans]
MTENAPKGGVLEPSVLPDSPAKGPEATRPARNLDEAYFFLEKVNNIREDEALDLKSIRRKVDWRIVPIMFLCYTMQFLDKVSLNVAYLVAEIPTGYVLNKISAPKWLGINVILWGIATACTAAAHNYATLLAARIFLGIFEASISPCLVLISSQWYTKSEQAPRFSLWFCGLGLGQIVGGLVSYGFQHVRGGSFSGWKTMFIALGAFTVIVGTGMAIIIPDSPMKAVFLSDQEKAALLKHVSVNKTGVKNKHFKLRHIVEMLKDIQVWLMVLLVALAALLNTPSGLVTIVSTILSGVMVRYKSHRWACIVACCLPGIIGCSLMSFVSKDNHAGVLTGIYLVNCIVPTLVLVYQWVAANVAGSTKRSASVALVTASFGVGNIIAPQTFQAKDAPQFIPAKIAVLATQATAAVVAVVIFLYYLWENHRRDRVQLEMSESSSEEANWDNLTDKENPAFRYTY